MIFINEYDFICRNNIFEAGHVYNTLIYRQQFNKCFYIENTSAKLSSEGLETTKRRPLTYFELIKNIANNAFNDNLMKFEIFIVIVKLGGKFCGNEWKVVLDYSSKEIKISQFVFEIPHNFTVT